MSLMPSKQLSDVKFEIGHVLLIDIVGYSKLLINEQSEQIQKLRQIIRGTEQFRIAEAEGKLLRLPTGDGGALVFRTSPEAPVRCAVEISKELKGHPELRNWARPVHRRRRLLEALDRGAEGARAPARRDHAGGFTGRQVDQ